MKKIKHISIFLLSCVGLLATPGWAVDGLGSNNDKSLPIAMTALTVLGNAAYNGIQLTLDHHAQDAEQRDDRANNNAHNSSNITESSVEQKQADTEASENTELKKNEAPQEEHHETMIFNERPGNQHFIREIILPTTDHNCGIFGIYGRADITRINVINELIKQGTGNTPRAQRIRELMRQEIVEYLHRQVRQNNGLQGTRFEGIINRYFGSAAASFTDSHRAQTLLDILEKKIADNISQDLIDEVFVIYLQDVLGRRMGPSEDDPYPLLEITQDGTGALAAIAYMEDVNLRIWQRNTQGDTLELIIEAENSGNNRVVDLLHTTADRVNAPNAHNHFNLLQTQESIDTIHLWMDNELDDDDAYFSAPDDWSSDEEDYVYYDVEEGLSNIKSYQHVPVSKQFENYSSIYQQIDNQARLEGKKPSEVHSHQLFQTITCGSFALCKDLLIELSESKQGTRDNDSLNIQEGNLVNDDFEIFQDPLQFLDYLYQSAEKMDQSLRFTSEEFFRFNIILARIVQSIGSLEKAENNTFYLLRHILRVETPIYSDLKQDIDQNGAISSENIQELFNIFTYGMTLARANDLKPFIIYTNCGSGIGEKRFLEHASDNQAFLTTFDTTIRESPDHRYVNGRYYPHLGRYATFGFINHDYEHFCDTRAFAAVFPSWHEECIKPFSDALINNRRIDAEDKDKITQNKLLLLAKAAYFLQHEKEVMITIHFGGSGVVPSAYQFAQSIYNRMQTDSGRALTVLGNVLDELSNFSGSFAQLMRNRGNYKFVARDLETLLKQDIHFKNCDDNTSKFTWHPLNDSFGKPLLPSLDEMLEKAKKQDCNLVLDASKTKREQWKSIPKETRIQLKQEAIADGFRRYWLSVKDAMLEERSREILRGDYPLLYFMLNNGNEQTVLNLCNARSDLIVQLIKNLPPKAKQMMVQKLVEFVSSNERYISPEFGQAICMLSRNLQ